MSVRTSLFLMMALSLAGLCGCNKGKAIQKAVPAGTRPTHAAAEQKPPPAPSDPEPVPGEPVRLALPTDGGAWPWPVGKAAAPVDSVPVVFPNVPQFAVTGIAARPEIKRAVVSIKWEKKGQPPFTRLAYCDTAAGKVLTDWAIPAQQAVIDLSPDGRAILSTFSQPGQDRNTLRLWLIGTDNQLRRSAWTPHPAQRPEGTRIDPSLRYDAATAQEIRWAGFVGNERIVSVSRLGQLRIFDTDTMKPLAYLEGSEGRPAVSPDGSKVAIVTGNSITLVDPIAAAVIGSRLVGNLPQHCALAFSPDGTRLAIGGNGKALLLNLASGDLQEAVLPRLHVCDTGMFDKPFGWAGTDYLFADGHLHDLRFPAAVWDYTGVEQTQFQGQRIWFSAREAGTTTSTLVSYKLPHFQANMRTLRAAESPELFLFKSGDKVRVDAAGIPENRRAEVQAAVEQRLKTLGYNIDPAAAAVLLASVETTGTKASVSYVGSDIYPYMKKPAILRLVLNGKELWSEAWSIEPPLSIRLPAGVKLADHMKHFSVGEPNYQLFSLAPVPATFPGPQAPAAPLGTMELTGEKLRSWLPW